MRNLFLKENIFKNCLILLFGINFCQSCIKKNLPDYYMDENFRSYVDFPKGSYWIYQEKMGSGKSDSIYLYQREYTTDTRGRYADFNYDRINLRFYSSNYNDTLRAGGGSDVYINSGFFYYEVPSYFLTTNVQYFSGKGE